MEANRIENNPFVTIDNTVLDSLKARIQLDMDSLRVEPFDLHSLEGMAWIDGPFTYSFNSGSDLDGVLQISLFFFRNYSNFSLEVNEFTVAEECYSRLMNDYIHRFISKYGDSFLPLFHALILWKEFLFSVLSEVYYRSEVVYCTMTQMPWETHPLLRYLLKQLQTRFEGVVENVNNSLFKYIDNVILYNAWGKDYYSTIESIVDYLPMTDEEIVMTDYSENKNHFFNLVGNEVRGDESLALADRISELFKDYISRINKKTTRLDVIRFASEYWKEVTVSRLRLVDHSVENELAGEYNSSLCGEMEVNVAQVCDYYLSQLEKKKYLKDWSGVLLPLGIDYKRLYYYMRNQLFTGVDYDQFHDAFLSADFAEVMKGARAMGERTGNVGCIEQLVKVIGELAGKEWYQHAACSIMEEEDGTKAVRNIGKLKLTSSKNKDFATVLVKSVTKLRSKD